MNTNSNTYTVIYSTILVVIVAAVLAFVAKFLQPMQDANVKKDTISQILTAAGIEDTDKDVLDVYMAEIEKAILVNAEGQEVGTLNTTDKENLQVYGNSELKAQIAADAKCLPVYIFKNHVTVIPCYGAGLWGPIWGYIGLDTDLNTIKKACFGHKGETPGLGAKITDEPKAFADHFAGKKIGKETIEILEKKVVVENDTIVKPDTIVKRPDFFFEVAKASRRTIEENGVDAISGATITSEAVGKSLNQWFGFYEEYFKKNAKEE